MASKAKKQANAQLAAFDSDVFTVRTLIQSNSQDPVVAKSLTALTDHAASGLDDRTLQVFTAGIEKWLLKSSHNLETILREAESSGALSPLNPAHFLMKERKLELEMRALAVIENAVDILTTRYYNPLREECSTVLEGDITGADATLLSKLKVVCMVSAMIFHFELLRGQFDPSLQARPFFAVDSQNHIIGLWARESYCAATAARAVHAHLYPPEGELPSETTRADTVLVLGGLVKLCLHALYHQSAFTAVCDSMATLPEGQACLPEEIATSEAVHEVLRTEVNHYMQLLDEVFDEDELLALKKQLRTARVFASTASVQPQAAALLVGQGEESKKEVERRRAKEDPVSNVTGSDRSLEFCELRSLFFDDLATEKMVQLLLPPATRQMKIYASPPIPVEEGSEQWVALKKRELDM